MSSIAKPAPDQGAAGGALARHFYLAAWRWHFYAGLYVIPFLVMLAITGLAMLWIGVVDGRDGETIAVTPQETPLPASVLAAAALASRENGRLVEYIVPAAADRAAVFRVDVGPEAKMVAVDPYTASLLSSWDRQAGWYDFASDIHGTLLIGTLGDRLIEIAAGFGVVLIVTGLYLWWPRRRPPVPGKPAPGIGAGGRPLWKSLHRTTGSLTAPVLLVFLLTGLSWSGIWGERFVQAWSTFPAEKWDNVPLSDTTHAAMNHGATRDVPWGLEQTPMPMSGSDAGRVGITPGTPVDLDSVLAFARSDGFGGRFRITLPAGENGVWTLSRDSMSNDSTDPTADRTVHVDRHTGKVLAEIVYADYSPGAKAMAVGIAFHEGDMGWWNVALNTVFCLSVIFMSVSGAVMWWLRRPKNAFRLAAPPMPAEMPMWRGAVVAMLCLSLAFPLVGLTLLGVLALDLLVIRNIGPLARIVG